jgi:hypothetical protein
MKITNLAKYCTIITLTVVTILSGALAQVTNNTVNNTQEIGDGAQNQRADGGDGSSEVTITEEDKKDNFWSNSYRGFLSIPPGAASIICTDQAVSFSRTGGVGIGLGATGINFSDNSGDSPEELQENLAMIRQCAKENNASQIMQKYINLLGVSEAVANTYLRAVSPELYATFVVENARIKGSLVSRTSYQNLTTNLRNKNFDRVIEWQDNYYAAGIEENRIKSQHNQEMRSLKVKKQLAELEIIELERKAKEIEAILNQKRVDIQQINN